MVQRLSKLEAARVLQVHHSTVDRMIQRGELNVEREGDGKRSKVWVLLDGPPVDSPEDASEGSLDGASDSSFASSNGSSPIMASQPGDVAADVEVAALRERVMNLEDLVEHQRKEIADGDWRYQQLLEQLAASQRISENLSRPLPPAEAADGSGRRLRWWPFRKSQ